MVYYDRVIFVWSEIGFFFFKQKTAYEMRISDWSSDVCSSDLPAPFVLVKVPVDQFERRFGMMLEDGLVVPFRCELTDVLKGMPISDRYHEKWRTRSHRSFATLSGREIGRAHVETPVNNAHLVCRLLLDHNNVSQTHTQQ